MITPATILAALLALMPAPASEHPRYQIAAEAIATVHAEFLPSWPRDSATLFAAQLTIIDFESDMQRGVHDGTIRGKAGEVCLMQAHRTNGFWARYGSSLDELAGTDLESTLRCIRTGTATLVWAANRCLKQHYRRNLWPAMFSAYHLGGQCWASPERFKRARAMQTIVGMIQQGASE
ncbi:MAG TPA: hypothetical protein VHO25_22095 [Polyangiaceae bacterium]|nr:hypothetical protein [Polyangiaceae bacterium]